jgi:hypothetical protein
MLSKFSVQMMVLLIAATAASLVGISSIIYKPASLQSTIKTINQLASQTKAI